MEMNEIKWQSFSDYLTKTNPILQKQEALYRLTFQNGKIYFGQSTDILARIETHLVKIQGFKEPFNTKWYSDAGYDNGLKSKPLYEIIRAIKIEIYPCNNSYELEQELLYKERELGHQEQYYNSQFYKPRNKCGREKEGNRSAVIF